MKLTEKDLIEGCCSNNPKCQKLLYELFSRKMMGVCLRYASSNMEAEDLLQDGFVKVFEKIHTFKGKGSFNGWIRRIFVNTAIDNYRKQKETRKILDIDDVGYMLVDNDFILERMSVEELLRILQQIPLGYRTVFNLYAIEGFNHKEISDKLGITVNTSKSQYSRAKVYLQKLIVNENKRKISATN